MWLTAFRKLDSTGYDTREGVLLEPELELVKLFHKNLKNDRYCEKGVDVYEQPPLRYRFCGNFSAFLLYIFSDLRFQSAEEASGQRKEYVLSGGGRGKVSIYQGEEHNLYEKLLFR